MSREVIRDEDLRRLVDRRSHRMMLVLVEPRGATVDHTLDRPHGSMSPARVQVAVPQRDRRDGETMAAEIARITGRPPRYLRAAGAFVTEASGDQLAEIASLPSVATIRPSRYVHVRAARAFLR